MVRQDFWGSHHAASPLRSRLSLRAGLWLVELDWGTWPSSSGKWASCYTRPPPPPNWRLSPGQSRKSSWRTWGCVPESQAIPSMEGRVGRLLHRLRRRSYSLGKIMFNTSNPPDKERREWRVTASDTVIYASILRAGAPSCKHQGREHSALWHCARAIQAV